MGNWKNDSPYDDPNSLESRMRQEEIKNEDLREKVKRLKEERKQLLDELEDLS